MSYYSPAKKGQQTLNQSQYSAFSPSNTTMRKPNNIQNQTFSTLGTSTPGKYVPEVEQLQNEKNNYKTSFHQTELELLKAQQQIQSLNDELDYYKAKQMASPSRSVYQRELDASSVSPLRQSIREKSAREEALEQEVSRLRKQLIEKSQQTEEWIKRATRAEVKANGEFNVSEELQAKQDMIEKLNRELTQLQIKSQDVGRLEREISDLKALLQFKDEENERLRREKTEIQLEHYKSKQTELNLKDCEVRLNSELKNLKGQLTDTVKENETIMKVKQHIYDEELKNMKEEAEVEKTMLHKDLQTVEGLLNNKSQECENIRRQESSTKDRLREVEYQSRQNRQTAEIWRERATSAEKEVQYVQEKSIQDQEKLKQEMKRNHSIEKMVLEDKIKTLRNIVSRKEDELSNAHMSLAETNQKKREIELAKLRLQGAVSDLEKKNDEIDRTYQTQLRVKDQVHNQQINNLRSSHDFEQQRLNKSIDALRYVADKSIQEREQERERASNYQREYLRSAEKHRKAEDQADFWKTHSSFVERQKNQEVERAENLRKSQIDSMKRSHHKEIADRDLTNNVLSTSLVRKDRELNDLRYDNTLARSQALQHERMQEQARVEAGLWRSKAEEEQNRRLIDNSVHSHLRREEGVRNDLALSQTKLAYSQEINTLNNIIDRKDEESQDWRNNYHRVLRSKY